MTQLDGTDQKSTHDRSPKARQERLPDLVNQGTVVRAMRVEFSGPLPHPRVLGEYNEAIPGAADRIMRMSESELDHRQRLEYRGQTFIFAIGAISLIGGIALIALGKSVEGLVPLISAIVGLGGTLIYREVQSQREEAELLENEPGTR